VGFGVIVAGARLGLGLGLGLGLLAKGLLLLRDSLRLGDDGYLLPVRVPFRGYDFIVMSQVHRWVRKDRAD